MLDTTAVTDELMDDETWLQIVSVGGGFMASSLSQGFVERSLSFDLPNELYGVALAAVFFSADMDYTNDMAVGAGLYSVDAAAQRFGLKQSVSNIGGDN